MVVGGNILDGPVITQVVGWAKPDPITNWQQLGRHLPTVTLGRCPRHLEVR
jgi:hypothetical protein